MKSIIKFDKKRVYILLLLSIIIFHGLNNYIILKKDTVPLNGHEGANYVESVQRYEHTLSSPYQSIYPPLLLLSSQPLYRIFGTNNDIAVMTNMIFFAILIFSTYGIGKVMRDEETGLLAAFTVSMFPAIFGFSRLYLPDFALTAVITLGVYLLIKTNDFQDKKYSLLFGLITGLGMLTKWTYAIFLIPPSVIILFKSFFNKRITRRLIFNLFLIASLAIAISSFWYFPHIKNGLLQTLITASTYADKNFIYLSSLKGSLLGFGYFIISPFCLFLFIFSKNKIKYELFSWLIVPLFFFSFLPTQSPRYILPLLPSLALIISLSILRLQGTIKRIRLFQQSKKVGYLIVTAFLLFGLMQFFFLSYNKFDQFTSVDSILRQNTGLMHAQHADWELEEVYQLLDSTKDKPDQTRIVCASLVPLSSVMLHYSIINHLPIRFDYPIYCLERDKIYCSHDKYPDLIKNADYVIIESEEWEKNLHWLAALGRDHKKDFDAFIEEFKKQKNNFELVKRVYLNKEFDDSSLYFYKKRDLK